MLSLEHAIDFPHGGLVVHCAEQLADDGGKAACPVGVWATGIVFGS